jgi:type I restriction-modification system DNA methylase subunit
MPELDKTKGQVFTPNIIIDYMVENSFQELGKTDIYSKQGFYRILEPSCGDGRFVIGCLKYADKHNLNVKITAVDIDQRWIDYCLENIQDDRVKFICGNTLLMNKSEFFW